VLFVPTYQEPRPRPGSSSDSIGYGITSSGALVHELCRLGCEVRVLTTDTDAPDCRETFAARVAAAVPSAVHTFRPDVIFLFHSFATPASLIRLALLDAKEPTPIIGYLHGSHWDPTDTYRSEAYPGLKWLDLANLMALIVSPPMHDNRPDAAVRAFHMSGSHHIPACTGPVSPYRGMSALRCHA